MHLLKSLSSINRNLSRFECTNLPESHRMLLVYVEYINTDLDTAARPAAEDWSLECITKELGNPMGLSPAP